MRATCGKSRVDFPSRLLQPDERGVSCCWSVMVESRGKQADGRVKERSDFCIRQARSWLKSGRNSTTYAETRCIVSTVGQHKLKQAGRGERKASPATPESAFLGRHLHTVLAFSGEAVYLHSAE